jgi:hypothetical protein
MRTSSAADFVLGVGYVQVARLINDGFARIGATHEFC